MKFLAAIFVSLIALQGCVTDDGLTGTGPVTLNDRQKSHFEEWGTNSVDRDPLYFFLVRGGSSDYVFCPDTVALCRDALESVSKQQCDARYGQDAGRLYGVYGAVVWKFTEAADPNWWNERRGPIVEAEARSIKIKWGGLANELVGTLSYRKAIRKYQIELVLPGETSCDGTAEFTRKTWSIKCDNGDAASGSFRPLGESQGSIGEGADNNGNRIEFRVGPSAS
jgi:hypothetical protein